MTYPHDGEFPAFAPQRPLHNRIYSYCYGIGLTRWFQMRPIIDLGHRLVALGDDVDTAVRKACELADEVAKERA
jgi:hypothetical protein